LPPKITMSYILILRIRVRQPAGIRPQVVSPDQADPDISRCRFIVARSSFLKMLRRRAVAPKGNFSVLAKSGNRAYDCAHYENLGRLP
jgi:hypothetical protein